MTPPRADEACNSSCSYGQCHSKDSLEQSHKSPICEILPLPEWLGVISQLVFHSGVMISFPNDEEEARKNGGRIYPSMCLQFSRSLLLS